MLYNVYTIESYLKTNKKKTMKKFHLLLYFKSNFIVIIIITQTQQKCLEILLKFQKPCVGKVGLV